MCFFIFFCVTVVLIFSQVEGLEFRDARAMSWFLIDMK